MGGCILERCCRHAPHMEWKASNREVGGRTPGKPWSEKGPKRHTRRSTAEKNQWHLTRLRAEGRFKAEARIFTALKHPD